MVTPPSSRETAGETSKTQPSKLKDKGKIKATEEKEPFEDDDAASASSADEGGDEDPDGEDEVDSDGEVASKKWVIRSFSTRRSLTRSQCQSCSLEKR